MVYIKYFLLFLEGFISFISPCILPMIPIYISYFIGDKKGNKNKALINSISFVIGFSIIFIMLGAMASSFGLLISKHITLVNTISGLLLIIFGLNYIGILNVNFLQKSFKKGDLSKNELGVMSSLLFGIIFAIGWTPCVGPFLSSALMLASNSKHILEGVTMLALYSLGLGIPFILSAILIEYLKDAFDFIKRNYRLINTISGVLLIIVGIMMLTGNFRLLISYLSVRN